MIEIWTYVKGYERKYSVSTMGRIFSHLRNKILKPIPHMQGYQQTVLQRNRLRLHRVVAMNFITNPENKREVNHKNGVKDDNRAVNLEWLTPSENSQHSYDKLGRKPAEWITRRGSASIAAKPVKQFDLNGNFIRSYGSATEAAESLGVTQKHISNALTGWTKTSCGFKWEFA